MSARLFSATCLIFDRPTLLPLVKLWKYARCKCKIFRQFTVIHFYLPGNLGKRKMYAQLLIKFTKLLVWSKKIRWIGLALALHFENVHVVLFWIIPLLITVYLNGWQLTLLLHPWKNFIQIKWCSTEKLSLSDQLTCKCVGWRIAVHRHCAHHWIEAVPNCVRKN